MTRLAWVVLLGGCATVSPLQTASAVDEGRWRVGAQASAAGFCGSVEGPVPTACTEYPDGVPLPELRVGARRGLPGRADVGLSLQGLAEIYAPARPLQVGLTLDAKREVLSVHAGSLRHVVSLGVLLAAAVAGRLGLEPFVQADWGVSALYGLQTRRYEWVLGAVASRRAFIDTAGARSPLPVVESTRVGVSAGLFRRSPAGWALQVAYLAEVKGFSSGALQVQYGVFWDL